MTRNWECADRRLDAGFGLGFEPFPARLIGVWSPKKEPALRPALVKLGNDFLEEVGRANEHFVGEVERLAVGAVGATRRRDDRRVHIPLPIGPRTVTHTRLDQIAAGGIDWKST